MDAKATPHELAEQARRQYLDMCYDAAECNSLILEAITLWEKTMEAEIAAKLVELEQRYPRS